MPKELTYVQKRAEQLTLKIREIIKHLPSVCADFLLSISNTTQPLTRYAYATDMKLFFEYLARENRHFSDKSPEQISVGDLSSLTSRDISLYLDYLSLYYNDNESVTNTEISKQRKLATLRSLWEYMFKNELIKTDVTRLVDMPVRHEKPIIRMEIDEVRRMLDIVENGEGVSAHQKKYNDNTRVRDMAIISLFLGTGIRVSELVGIDIDDIDFDINAFHITRKGGNEAILYFPDEVADALKAYLDIRNEMEVDEGSENALFISLKRQRMGVRAVENMVKKYATLAAPLKKKLSPHKLRSTFGTNLYHETGDIYLVADVLGHSDVNTTRRHYADMTEEHRKIAAQHIKLRGDGNKNDISE